MSLKKEQELFWQNKWELEDIPFNQEKPNLYLIEYFDVLNLKPGSRVLVPLCGKSIDMLWLVNQGYSVVGVELSTLACEAFFKEHSISFNRKQKEGFTLFESKHVCLWAGDFFTLNKKTLGAIDAVFDRAALIALPHELRAHYVKTLEKLMHSETQMLLISMSYDQKDMQGPPFSVDREEVTALYSKHFKMEVLIDKKVAAASHLQARGLHQISEQVYCFQKQMQKFHFKPLTLTI